MPMDPKSHRAFRAYLAANQRVSAEQTRSDQFMTVSILNTFLGVALWGGDDGEPTTLETIAANLGISPTTLSTHLRYLGDTYREGKPGLGLVELEPYILNRRMKVVRLTRKGKTLADQIAYILQNGVPANADKETPQ